MPFPLLIPLALSAASAIGGALGNRNKKQTSTSTTTPTLDPAFRGIQDVLINNIQQRLRSPSSLPQSYIPQQTAGINQTFNLANQSLQNRLTASGLAQSPIAGAGARYLEGQRGGAIVQMKQQVPLIERDMQNQDLAQAIALLGSGRGQTTTTEGTVPGAGGGGLAGGVSGLASMLGFLYGQGAFSRPNIPGTGGTFDPYRQSMYVGL
jgi:hypothetical protein